MPIVLQHIRTYPRLCCIAACFLSAYVLYALGAFHGLDTMLNGYQYISIFIAGMLFSFGFTSAFGAAIFIELGDHIHPIYGAIIGGIGAMIADLTIFEVLKLSLKDELTRLSTTRLLLWLKRIFLHESFPERIKTYILWSLAGIILASPLPDEMGIALLSTLRTIEERTLVIFCFVINTIGIAILLEIGALAGGRLVLQ